MKNGECILKDIILWMGVYKKEDTQDEGEQQCFEKKTEGSYEKNRK